MDGREGARTELPSGVIQMGARSYMPQLGRFLTPDPVPGGSANPYDYADQDPVNNSDLEGNCSAKSCHKRPSVSNAKQSGGGGGSRGAVTKRFGIGNPLKPIVEYASNVGPTAVKVVRTAAKAILKEPEVLTEGYAEVQHAVNTAVSYVIEGLSTPVQEAAESCDKAFAAGSAKQAAKEPGDLLRAVRYGAYACIGGWLGSL
jgi:RHS repeat-associated protein